MNQKQTNTSNPFKILDGKTGKKIVYLVADKNCLKYAHLLQTLISSKHNIKCTIYPKKVYKDNMSKVSSENLMIFLGNNKISKALPNLKNKAKEDFGLFYGWYGTRAKIAIKIKILSKKKHDEFVKYYKNLYSEFEKDIMQYNIKELGKDIAVAFLFGGIGLGVKYIKKYFTLDKDLQYKAALMEFYKKGLHKFVKEAGHG